VRKLVKRSKKILISVFGPSHPSVLDILKKIEMISLIFKLEGNKESEILQHLQKDINIAVSAKETIGRKGNVNYFCIKKR
jgi:hypothetical protein